MLGISLGWKDIENKGNVWSNGRMYVKVYRWHRCSEFKDTKFCSAYENLYKYELVGYSMGAAHMECSFI
jgi:hypothetical protein